MSYVNIVYAWIPGCSSMLGCTIIFCKLYTHIDLWSTVQVCLVIQCKSSMIYVTSPWICLICINTLKLVLVFVNVWWIYDNKVMCKLSHVPCVVHCSIVEQLYTLLFKISDRTIHFIFILCSILFVHKD